MSVNGDDIRAETSYGTERSPLLGTTKAVNTVKLTANAYDRHIIALYVIFIAIFVLFGIQALGNCVIFGVRIMHSFRT